LQQKVRNHLAWAADFAAWIEKDPEFEILAPAPLATVCFRFNPGNTDEESLNEINKKLLDEINASEKVFLTHTSLNGKFTIRFVVGQTYSEKHHIEQAWQIIKAASQKR
jgi:aromatic-L-amino-acid decarboxylase